MYQRQKERKEEKNKDATTQDFSSTPTWKGIAKFSQLTAHSSQLIRDEKSDPPILILRLIPSHRTWYDSSSPRPSDSDMTQYGLDVRLTDMYCHCHHLAPWPRFSQLQCELSYAFN